MVKYNCLTDVAGRHPSGILVVFVRYPRGIRAASWLASIAPTSGYSSIPSPLSLNRRLGVNEKEEGRDRFSCRHS